MNKIEQNKFDKAKEIISEFMDAIKNCRNCYCFGSNTNSLSNCIDCRDENMKDFVPLRQYQNIYKKAEMFLKDIENEM